MNMNAVKEIGLIWMNSAVILSRADYSSERFISQNYQTFVGNSNLRPYERGASNLPLC